MDRDLEYENNNIGYDYQYTKEDGGGIKCKNYEICLEILPQWWFECKGKYLCTNCDMMFGTWSSGNYKQTGKGILLFKDNIHCSICLEYKRGVTYPNCNHYACIDCFRRCYYGDETREPIFPYPDIEEEYYDDPDNPKWNIDYPLIQIYNMEHDKWLHEYEEKYTNEEFLRKCPLCRK